MRKTNQGIAIVTALVFLAFVGVVVTTALFLAVQNNRSTGDLVRTMQAQYAAESGIERVIQEYFYDLMPDDPANPNNTTRSLAIYRDKLDTYNDGILKTTTEHTDSSTGDTIRTTPNSVTVTGETEDGKFKVTFTRKDVNAPRRFAATSSRRTELSVQSIGVADKSIDLNNIPTTATQRILKQTLNITDAAFVGVDYALLSNNVNCIFCHSYVTTMEDAYTPSRTTGRIQRVKVATLQTLEVRQGSQPDTYIGGTLYTRGNFKRDPLGGGSGDYTATDLPSLGVKTHDVSPADGTVGVTQTNLEWQDCNVTCVKHKNFYKNYPASGPDGEIPSAFPVPIPDKDNDRWIDDDEWQGVIRWDSGGKLEGGTKQLFAPGTPYNAAQPSMATLQVDFATNPNGINGNLVLTGTIANPLKFDGTVYVNGDVIINGRVGAATDANKVRGMIIARGNIYVVGDLEYTCSATGSCDYTQPNSLPLLGLIAGGNVVLGDAFTPRVRFGSNYVPSPTGAAVSSPQTFGAVSNPLYIEPIATRNGTAVRLRYGSAGSVGVTQGWMTGTAFAASFVTGQIGAFNRAERNKAIANPTYIPRFYAFGGDPFYITNSTAEEPGQFSGVTMMQTSLLPPTRNAVIMDVAPATLTGTSTNPKTSWISLVQLKQMWIDNIETPTRPNTSYTTSTLRRFSTNSSSRTKALHIDAVLYSSNAVFSLARADSKVKGSTIINGSIVAADIGFLSSGRDGGNSTSYPNMQYGLRIQYDSRFKSLGTLGQGISLLRSNYTLEKQ